MQGWIKLHRKIQEHAFFQEKRVFSKFEAWIDILLLANHKDNKVLIGNELIHVVKGSFITSELKLMNRWGWSKTKVRSFLKLLEHDEMITKKSDNKKTTLTVCNYCNYQDFETIEKPQKDHEQTTERLQKDTNKNVKNVKNVKNEKNKKINSRKRVYDDDSIHYQLADRLFQKILLNNPEYKQPNLQKWADDIRLMMDIDKRNEEQIIYVIDWCQTHQFWKTNILSVSKLREKYDQLVIQIKAGKTDKPKPKKEALPADFEKWQRAGEQKNEQQEYDDDFEMEREKLAAELAAMKR